MTTIKIECGKGLQSTLVEILEPIKLRKSEGTTYSRSTFELVGVLDNPIQRIKDYEKALWWYNLPLSKKKSLFNKRFFDDKFDMNKIHKEIITILYDLHLAPKESKKEIALKRAETDKIIKDFKASGRTIRI